MRPSKVSRFFAVLASLIVFAAIVLGIYKYVTPYIVTDYGTLPPATAYREIFGQDIPDGVRDLTVAGHGIWQGRLVWMSMHASKTAIAAITAATFPIAPGTYKYVMPDVSMAGAVQDAKTAKWDEVPQVKNAEFYLFRNLNNGKGWTGTVVVDHRNGQVYVSAHMQ